MIRVLPLLKRKAMVEKLVRLLTSAEARVDRVRIPACKLLIALLPLSEETIKMLLMKLAHKMDYEIQFTVFCYLDELLVLDPLPSFVNDVPMVIHEYLNRIQKDTARAAWMAADLLGDHWPPKEALPVLLRLAEEGRHRVGRSVAAKGLIKLLPRIQQSERKKVLHTLKRLSERDRSNKVKQAASRSKPYV
jgi:hypothetical protein